MLLWRQFTRFPIRCSRRESGGVQGIDLDLGCLCARGMRRSGTGKVDYTSLLKVVNICYVVEILGEKRRLERECAQNGLRPRGRWGNVVWATARGWGRLVTCESETKQGQYLWGRRS